MGDQQQQYGADLDINIDSIMHATNPTMAAACKDDSFELPDVDFTITAVDFPDELSSQALVGGDFPVMSTGNTTEIEAPAQCATGSDEHGTHLHHDGRVAYALLTHYTEGWSTCKLGEGGFGSVFLGVHPSGTHIAIKR